MNQIPYGSLTYKIIHDWDFLGLFYQIYVSQKTNILNLTQKH